MEKESYRDLLTKREAAMFYNLGLKKGLYVLEVAENLAPGKRHYLIEAFEEDIARKLKGEEARRGDRNRLP